jgi:hypothetical protein
MDQLVRQLLRAGTLERLQGDQLGQRAHEIVQLVAIGPAVAERLPGGMVDRHAHASQHRRRKPQLTAQAHIARWKRPQRRVHHRLPSRLRRSGCAAGRPQPRWSAVAGVGGSTATFRLLGTSDILLARWTAPSPSVFIPTVWLLVRCHKRPTQTAAAMSLPALLPPLPTHLGEPAERSGAGTFAVGWEGTASTKSDLPGSRGLCVSSAAGLSGEVLSEEIAGQIQRRCCMKRGRETPKPRTPLIQMAAASSSNAIASRRPTNASTASS